MTMSRIIVIGAGAGGMMAAGRAAELGVPVLLLEKNARPGKKILISGKARCNLTNTKELDDFIAMYGPNGRFLYRAFSRYFRDDLLTFLRRYGVAAKTEGDGRVFPASDDARDVLRALERYMADHRVQLRTRSTVDAIEANSGKVTGVQVGQERITAAAVILATGGASHPETGSSGDGYRLAAALGHTITRLRPALVPLAVEGIEQAMSMQGVSLRHVRLTAYRCPASQIDPSLTPTSDWGRGLGSGRPSWPIIESRMGDMIVTHFGISGPITLLMSLAIVDALEHGPVSVSIDLKPTLDNKQLLQQLQWVFDRYGKRSYHVILKELLPHKLINPFVAITGIPPEKRGNEITAEERERLCGSLKSLRFDIAGPLSMSDAMVTAGGVSLKEIDPHTMSSRLVGGLYFCGEVMDLDADTGGYNLQAAFSTGYIAGEQAALRVVKENTVGRQ